MVQGRYHIFYNFKKKKTQELYFDQDLNSRQELEFQLVNQYNLRVTAVVMLYLMLFVHVKLQTYMCYSYT
jgi:hypothetical protein